MHQFSLRLLCCLLLSFTSGFAQQRACNVNREGNAQIIDNYLAELLQSAILLNPRGVEATQMNIPVVFHVIYHTPQENLPDSFFHSQIEVLNEDFQHLNADSINTPPSFDSLAGGWSVTFRLANVAPNGMPSTGINRIYTNELEFLNCDDVKFSANGGADIWDPSYYLNIWICHLGNGYLGQAQYPGGSPFTDGVVVDYSVVGRNGLLPPYNKGRTVTHEVGHFLGLYHTWGAFSSECNEDDSINDTPLQYEPTFGCPQGVLLDNCTTWGDGIMYMNYMDYTDDACMNLFTQAQVQRMYLVLNTIRPTLINSYGYNDTGTTELPATSLLHSAIQLYPNPVQDILQVEILSPTPKNITLTLSDALGRIYEKRSIFAQESNILSTFDVKNLSSGLYFLQIDSEDTKIIRKFIRQ